MRAWLERSFRNRIFLTVLLVALVPLLLCAVLFSFQIMAVNHYGPQMDGVRLSCGSSLWWRWKARWQRCCWSTRPRRNLP